MDNFDIYADLPDFAWLKQEYEADVDVIKQELPTSKEDIIELKTKLLKLEKVHRLVLSHYSSLWKTAKQERKRMERQITELRSQLDNLAFRRNHHQRNHNINPLSVAVNAYPAIAFPASNNYQFNYPPPLMSQTFAEQLVGTNLCSYPPPPIHSTVTTNQEIKQQEETLDEHFVDNLTVSSNIITPENSHSSDESEDDIVKKSEYRSTVYGERLRKKLLDEKRNAAKQKKESLLNENKANENKLDHEKTEEPENVDKTKNLNTFRDEETKNMIQKTDIRTVKEENNNRKISEIDTQSIQAPYKQPQLRNDIKIEAKVNIKNNELNIENHENDIGRKKTEDDSRSRKDDMDKERADEDCKLRRERDLNKRKQDEQLERERDLERNREDESRIRREKDLERRRKEEIEKAKREEQFEKRRREEEIERKRRNQEVERKRKEETEKRRREEVNRRRRDEEIERRKKEEIDKRRREEIEKRRKGEEIERRKKEEVEKRKRDEAEKRKKEDLDRKRKEEEIERRKRDETEKRRREEEATRRKKEEEQHKRKLKEIEKNRNEKQLEELIKERERIEKEMKNMKDEETEEGEITESFNNTSCKEQSGSKKPQVHKQELKETCRDKSKQSQKNESNSRRNDDFKFGGRSTRSNSSRVTNQTINDNRRKGHHEYASCKSDRHQDNHISYDKHKRDDLRSRRDQVDRERERRKSSHRNKSRNRNRSNSGHRSDEDRDSPKRIRLQEKDKEHRDKLKDNKVDKNSKIVGKSPKRRRQTKSNERSPQNSKKRKMSPEKDLGYNIKSNKNDAPETITQASNKPDDAKNIIDNALSNENTSSSATENVENFKDNVKEEKEKFIELLGKDQDQIANKLTNPHKEDQVKDSVEGLVKHANSQTDKKGTNHANKIKSLMNELFEVQEKAVDTSANLEQVKNFEETSDETIITELEDGEITDSDESTNLENLPKVVHSQSTDKPIDTVNLFEKNKFEIAFSNNKLTTPLQKNNEEIASKGSSEIKDSISCNMLTESKNNINKENSKIELHESASNKKETVVFEDNNKSEACKEIVNNTDDAPSQIIYEKQTFANKTSRIECRVNKSSETVETNDVKKNVLSEGNENKTVSEPSDKINTIIGKEKQSNAKKPNDNMEVEKTDSKNSTKCISIQATSNILLEQPRPRCLKINNSENKLDNKERLQIKRSQLHSETNNMKNTCLKENVEMSNDFTKEHIGQPVIKEKLYEESSKPIMKSGNTSQDNAAEKSVNTPQTKVSVATVKKIIVVRRRRRPVQLSDSPPVLVINNMK